MHDVSVCGESIADRLMSDTDHESRVSALLQCNKVHVKYGE